MVRYLGLESAMNQLLILSFLFYLLHLEILIHLLGLDVIRDLFLFVLTLDELVLLILYDFRFEVAFLHLLLFYFSSLEVRLLLLYLLLLLVVPAHPDGLADLVYLWFEVVLGVESLFDLLFH